MKNLYSRMTAICLASLVGMTLAVSAQPTSTPDVSPSQPTPATVIVTEVLKVPERATPAQPLILSDDTTVPRLPAKTDDRPKGQSRSQESKPGVDKPLLEIKGF